MPKIIEVDKLSQVLWIYPSCPRYQYFVEKGDLFAFLGPNGAGKSTTD
jgi:multidrug/hemolysin transport system ATP-binding protein